MKKTKSILVEMARILKTGRLQAGMTQEEMAKKIGVSQSSLSKMEAAKLQPSAIQWMKFSKFTHTKPDVLMQFVGKED